MEKRTTQCQRSRFSSAPLQRFKKAIGLSFSSPVFKKFTRVEKFGRLFFSSGISRTLKLTFKLFSSRYFFNLLQNIEVVGIPLCSGVTKFHISSIRAKILDFRGGIIIECL